MSMALGVTWRAGRVFMRLIVSIRSHQTGRLVTNEAPVTRATQPLPASGESTGR